MKRLLYLVSTALIVAAIVPANPSASESRGSSSHRLRKVYAHFAEPYQYKPRTLYIGNYLIEKLEWSRWNYSTTTGAGVFPYNNCKPYCAAGHITRYETTVTLGRQVLCPGKHVFIYTRLKYTLPPTAPTDGATFTMSCSGRYKGFHEL